MRQPYGIHQHGLFLFDQIGVLTRTVQNGIFISVKGFQFPVDVTDPADIVLN